MSTPITSLLTVACGLLHLGFMYLEMHLWTKPTGLRIFRQRPEQAESSRVLAANQGLYNGILSAGLFWTLTLEPAEWSAQAQLFFFSAVMVAGLYGAVTVSRRIFWIQTMPAALGLVALYFRW